MKFRHSLLLLFVATAFSAFAQSPKYIFYFIGDGMGHGAVMATDAYNRLVHNDSTALLMTQLPHRGYITTWSASSPVTDSAAAGTALATGHKTRNGMLGMDADSVAVRSVASELKDLGYGVALVTNVAPDDATPAAFYAHVPSRGMTHDIAVQAANSRVDFLAGSILRGTKTDGKYNGLYEEFTDRGVAVVRGLDNLNGVTASRVLLLNTDTIHDNGGQAIDATSGLNTLPDMTVAAINHLTAHTPDRFFMMVEGGNIDWAGHANDGPTIVKEVICFDEALRHAYDFYLAHPDETLILVTADHETGGVTVGQRSTGYNFYPRFIDSQRMSKDMFSRQCRRILNSPEPYTWEQMKEFLRENLGLWDTIPVKEADEASLQEKFNKTFVTRNDNPQHTLYYDFPEFSQAVYDVINRVCGFGFTSTNHTGNPVPLYAVGVGAEEIVLQHDNTDLPKTILKLVRNEE